MRSLHLLILCALGVFLALCPSALAQSGKSVVLRQRDTDMTIQPNGEAQLVETWVVNFHNGAFTFAFREIPKHNLRDIINISVAENSAPLPHTL